MDYAPGKWRDIPEIGGMKPWACSYSRGGERYAITLYGTDEAQVINDNCSDLPGLRVDGQLVSEASAIRR
ncbi:hypothetical protein [Oceaniglobus trochenteri]|uniref:hypothetical protein n=1 Tax=Oceaniglobus trochenteri TaxID=2763260 RepID=UPI001CFF89B2|nr:hypothetical protein [Oceaniglobus trochenteri]